MCSKEEAAMTILENLSQHYFQGIADDILNTKGDIQVYSLT
jgi:hypothetical protein